MAVFLHKVHDPSQASVCPLPPEPVAPATGVDADALDDEGEPCVVSVTLRPILASLMSKAGPHRLSQAAHLQAASGQPLTAS